MSHQPTNQSTKEPKIKLSEENNKKRVNSNTGVRNGVFGLLA